MQASVPHFVVCAIMLPAAVCNLKIVNLQHSVRVADLNQGSNAIRVTSIRSLPDIDVTGAMEGVDDGAKSRLNREHIVCIFTPSSYYFLTSGTLQIRDSRTSKYHLFTEQFQADPHPKARLRMPSELPSISSRISYEQERT